MQLFGDRDTRLVDVPPPPPPAPGEVQLRIRRSALNHIDVWGWRGMAFAKRKLPLIVGAEAVGEVVAAGRGRHRLAHRPAGPPMARCTCGLAGPAARAATISARTSPGVHGFHIDGFAQE